MTTVATVIDVLPQVGNNMTIYFTIIHNDDSLTQGTITNLTVMYGNVSIPNPSGPNVIPSDTQPAAILVTATDGGNTYISILYFVAIPFQIIPDNLARIIQKIPLGIFDDLSSQSIVGQDMAARANMINDFYVQYFQVVGQVFSNAYSPQLEFEYNGTVGLLSNSVYPNALFLLLASLSTVSLNVYDLELFVSRYINYRLGIICAVFLNDDLPLPGTYWRLGVAGETELDFTTILGPDFDNLENLNWTIYNTISFTSEFKDEIIKLILRISRADIGNKVTFDIDITPPLSKFSIVGYTYPNDPRLLFGRCLEFRGDALFPLNIFGYKYTG
jgi:hypothetical protein